MLTESIKMFKFSKIYRIKLSKKEVTLAKVTGHTPEVINVLFRISGVKEIERNGLNYKNYGKLSRFKRSPIQFNC